MNGRLSPLLTDSSSELALDNATTSGRVAQLTGHSTAAVLYITDPISPQLTDAQMLWISSQPTCSSTAVALGWTQQ